MLNWVGLGSITAGAAANALFALPMKYTRRWAFENVWLVFSFFALIAFPCALGYASIPQLTRQLIEAGAVTATLSVLGLFWGVGQVCFGLALQELGISLATAIMLGVSIAVGSGVPFFLASRDAKTGLMLLAVLMLTVAGVLLCTFAGQRRPASISRRGLLCSLVAGGGAGLFNVAVSSGAPIVRTAIAHGGNPHFSQMVAWVPFLLGGAIPNLGFCFHRLLSRGSVAAFRDPAARLYWAYAIMMAVFWLGSSLLYGFGALRLGTWGPAFGFPVYISLIVVCTTVLGLLIGEWRQASSRSLVLLHSGVVLLVASVFLTVGVNRAFGEIR
jgi:L-rhamnose-H+ transport protein